MITRLVTDYLDSAAERFPDKTAFVDDNREQKDLMDYDTWDSVAVLSVISIMNEKFEKFPSAKDVLKNTTVSELMEFLQ